MSLYALHANALRPLVSKYKGRSFRGEDDVREFVDDLLSALLGRGAIQIADTLRIRHDGEGPALVIEGDGDWEDCPIQMIPVPNPDECMCKFTCCEGAAESAVEDGSEECVDVPVGNGLMLGRAKETEVLYPGTATPENVTRYDFGEERLLPIAQDGEFVGRWVLETDLNRDYVLENDDGRWILHTPFPPGVIGGDPQVVLSPVFYLEGRRNDEWYAVKMPL